LFAGTTPAMGGGAGKGKVPAGTAAPVPFPTTLAALLTPLGSLSTLVRGDATGDGDADRDMPDGQDSDGPASNLPVATALAANPQLAAVILASNAQHASVIPSAARNLQLPSGAEQELQILLRPAGSVPAKVRFAQDDGVVFDRTALDRAAPGRAAAIPPAELARLTAAARAARGPVDPSAVQNGLNLLDPVFRTKLERVIDRMKQEFGSTVEVVETYRAPQRQAMLYAQGRTQPGPVVTWTRSSNHQRGLAADLMVDGSYDHPAAYARLARVAAEEGLRTLGPRDPGHVELPVAGTDARDLPLPPAPTVAEPSPRSGVATVARVAQVAPIAPVAQVAQVAQVATPGAAPASAPLAAVQPQPVERSPERRSDDAGQQSGGESSDAPTPRLADVAPPTPRLAGTPAPAAPGPAAPMGAEALDRVHRVLDLRDTAAARPLSSVVLRVDNPNGTRDRVRVSLRGASVGATVDLGSRAAIEPLASRVSELQQALGRHGLETDSVQVRAASARTDAADLARVAAALGGGGVTATATGSQMPQSGGNPLPQRDGQNSGGSPDRGSSQPHSDHPRQRSGRERRGEPNS
ncbi:MAG TPA: M15 family metallopeptidase, partial [Longimicrobiaceae bacterium]|nr:M15 family metallopeptidase [Longimicrobiaceae bacterium]